MKIGIVFSIFFFMVFGFLAYLGNLYPEEINFSTVLLVYIPFLFTGIVLGSFAKKIQTKRFIKLLLIGCLLIFISSQYYSALIIFNDIHHAGILEKFLSSIQLGIAGYFIYGIFIFPIFLLSVYLLEKMIKPSNKLP